MTTETRQQTLSNFIASNFTIRQCRRYVRVDFIREKLSREEIKVIQEDDCACGRPLEWHYVQGLTLRKQGPASNSKQISLEGVVDEAASYWVPERDTLQKMCHSFGEVLFAISSVDQRRLLGQLDCDGLLVLPVEKRANFLRLEGRDESDFVSRVCTLLTSPSFWAMQAPACIIDVIGRPYRHSPDLEARVVNQLTEMLRSANNDGIWLISEGKNDGVGRMVGRAVAKARFAVPSRQITCLGLTAWATVTGRQCLEVSSLPGAEKTFGFWPAEYELTTSAKLSSQLEMNHDCFLLIDNGKEFSSCLAQQTRRDTILFRNTLIDTLTDIGKISLSVGTSGRHRHHHDDTNKFYLDGASASAEHWLERRTNYFNRIPSVMVVIGGDLATLEAIRANLVAASITNSQAYETGEMKSRPVILLTSFGGVADLLSFALTLQEPKQPPANVKFPKKVREELANERVQYEKKIQSHPAFGQMLKDFESLNVEDRVKKESEILAGIMHCLTNRRYISTIELGKSRLSSQIVNSIFRTKQYSSRKTLELCILLNDVEGARKLFEEVESLGQNTNTMTELSSTVAVQIFELGLANFYKLFKSFHYFSPHTLLSASMTATLFRSIFLNKSNQFVKFLLQSSKQDTSHVFDELTVNEDKTLLRSVCRLLDKLIVTKSPLDSNENSRKLDVYYSTHMRDVFLLQLILNHEDLSVELWKDGVDHLGTALAASFVLKRLAQLPRRDSNATSKTVQTLSNLYAARSKEWERRAVALMCELNRQSRPVHLSEDFCSSIISRQVSNYFKLTPVELAFNAHLSEVVQLEVVQQDLTCRWFGFLSPTTNRFVIWLLTMCPLFWIFLHFVKFTIFKPESGINKQTEKTDAEQSAVIVNNKGSGCSGIRDADVEISLLSCCWKDIKDEEKKADSVPKIPFDTALICLYTAPISKFTLTVTTTIVFLLLVSQIVLSKIQPNSISLIEIVVWIWSFTFFCEYLRPFKRLKRLKRQPSVLTLAPNKTRTRYLEIGVQVLLILTMIMRWAQVKDTTYPRTTYSIVCFYHWIRLLETSTACRSLGITAASFKKMFKDFGFFLAFYAIMLVAFSVPIRAMLWPDLLQHSNSDDYLTLLTNVVYYRFWSLFHYFNLGDFEGTCPVSAKSTENLESFMPNETTTEATATTPSVYLFTPYNRTRCSQRNFFAVLLFITFMLFANIMLLNFLTALFTHTLQKVWPSCVQEWIFSYYALVEDFKVRMVLPPPLNFAQLVFEWIAQLPACRKHSEAMNSSDMKGQQWDSYHQSKMLNQQDNLDVIQRKAAVSIMAHSDKKLENNSENEEIQTMEDLQRKWDNDDGKEILSHIQAIGSRFDEQMLKLHRRLAEVEKMQGRMSAKMNNIELMSSAKEGYDCYPQSQNYA